MLNFILGSKIVSTRGFSPLKQSLNASHCGVFLLGFLCPIFAIGAPAPFYIGVNVGQSTLALNSSSHLIDIEDRTDRSIALLMGYELNPSLALELNYFDLGVSQYSANTTDYEAEYSAAGVQAVLSFPSSDSIFSGVFKLGLGTLQLDDNGSLLDASKAIGVTGALGLNYRLTNRVSVAGGYHVFSRDVSAINLGLQYQFGGRVPNNPVQTPVEAALPAGDGDQDGVNNSMDLCPNTNIGLPVSVTGCVEIYDYGEDDGYDSLYDKCPSTSRGNSIDASGCTLLERLAGVLEGVNFHVDSDRLTAAAQQFLNKVVVDLKANPSVQVLVVGHTDNTGSAQYNLTLSFSRAKSVGKYLIIHGVESSRLGFLGKGDSEPVSDNLTDFGRSENRRVELVVSNIDAPGIALEIEPYH